VHKTASVLAKLPKSQQPKARRALQEIWMAETKAAAELAFDAFVESYALKYERAADCLNQDRDAPLAFYDFPAEHWKHLSPCETFRRDQTTIGAIRIPLASAMSPCRDPIRQARGQLSGPQARVNPPLAVC
jgi:transposase-like protein